MRGCWTLFGFLGSPGSLWSPRLDSPQMAQTHPRILHFYTRGRASRGGECSCVRPKGGSLQDCANPIRQHVTIYTTPQCAKGHCWWIQRNPAIPNVGGQVCYGSSTVPGSTAPKSTGAVYDSRSLGRTWPGRHPSGASAADFGRRRPRTGV